MIIDIGAGTTEIAVISLAGLVASESVRIAGDEFDQSIIKYIKNEYNVVIGEGTAEQVKCQIGCAVAPAENVKISIRGRDMRTGMPRAIDITAQEVHEALKPLLLSIVNSVKLVLERTHPELASDIMEHGICLSGGGSQLSGVPDLIARETGLAVRLAADPQFCVSRGCAALIEDFDGVLQSPIVEVAGER
jgi:rod shape-determining protein MreB